MPTTQEWDYHEQLKAILPRLMDDYEILKGCMDDLFKQTDFNEIAEISRIARQYLSNIRMHCKALRELRAPRTIQLFDAHVANVANQLNVFAEWVNSNLEDPTNEWLGRHDPKRYATTDLLLNRLDQAFEEKFYEPLYPVDDPQL